MNNNYSIGQKVYFFLTLIIITVSFFAAVIVPAERIYLTGIALYVIDVNFITIPRLRDTNLNYKWRNLCFIPFTHVFLKIYLFFIQSSDKEIKESYVENINESWDVDFPKKKEKSNNFLIISIGSLLVVLFVGFFVADKFYYDGRLTNNDDQFSIYQIINFPKLKHDEILIKKMGNEKFDAIQIDKFGNYNGLIIKGVKQGVWIEWYDEFIISSKGFYIDGLFDWIEKYDYDGDMISNEKNFINYKLDYISYNHVKNFGDLLIQKQNKEIIEFRKFCSESLIKISRKNEILDQNPTQVILGMIKNPKLWSKVPIIKVSHENLKLLLQTEENRVSFRTFFTEDGDYILKDEVDRVNSKAPINRDKYDKDVLTVDERVNICLTIYNGDNFRFFPLANDSNNTWYTARENSFFSGKDSLFVTNIMYMYMNALDKALVDNNWDACDSVVLYISKFQKRYANEI